MPQNNLRIFTHTAAHIYPYGRFPRSLCAYLPIHKIRLRIFTHTAAHIYPYGCAYLPIRGQLSTGTYLRVYLFSQVAYNYIPVDLYPQPINQQNRSLRVTVYAPASPDGSLGCRPNQRFGCRQNTPSQSHSGVARKSWTRS